MAPAADDPDPSGEFVGRSAELHQLEKLIGQVEDGFSAALVVSGDPGMGKTSLVDRAFAGAGTAEVLRLTGYEAEAGFPFAGLQRFVELLPRAGVALAGALRDAFEVAFGTRSGPPATRMGVGMALLAALGAATERRPLLCAIDDAQWLDGESLDALAFAARRLDARAVGLVFTVRASPGVPLPLSGLPVLHLAPMSEHDLRILLASRATYWPSPHVAARLIAESDGNPLALLEHLSFLTREQLAGSSPLPPALPVGERLTAQFGSQVVRLPAPSRALLLLLAAAGSDEAELVALARQRLGIPPDAAAPAMRTLLTSRSRGLAFRHPLIRSVVYEGAGTGPRQEVHTALADAADLLGRQDAAAWHRAQADAGPNEQLAEQLELVATRARDRGGYAAEATFLALAVDRSSPGTPGWARRRLGAANAQIVVGDTVAARALLAGWHPEAVLGAEVRAVRARAERASTQARTGDEAAELLRAADEAARHPSAAWSIRCDALSVALETRQWTRGTSLRDVAGILRDQPLPEERMGDGVALIYRALALRCSSGYEAAADAMRQALSVLGGSLDSGPHASGRGDASAVWMVMEDLWDDGFASTTWAAVADLHQQRGSLQEAWYGLGTSAVTAARHGRFRQADDLLDEADLLGDAFGNPRDALWAMRLDIEAWRGSEEAVRAVAHRFLEVWNDKRRWGSAATAAHHALTTLELSLGRYAEALAHAQWVAVDDAPGYGSRVLPDLVEAASRLRNPDAAEHALVELTARATAAGTPLALGLLERSRALALGSSPEAASHFELALGALRDTPVRTERARTHLLYGEWLRRRKRRAIARWHLTRASTEFDDMGARLFRARAARELEAGQPSGEPSPAARQRADSLTAQEQRVSELVAEGLTNREVSERLFLSESTVDYHLAKIFRKRGITSRRQLRDVLGTKEAAEAGPQPRR